MSYRFAQKGRPRLALRLAVGISAAALLCNAAQAASTADALDADGGAAADGEVAAVVVTARKRTERLQDVPIAVTAVSGAQLSNAQHFQLQDLNQLAPSTNIVVSSPRQGSFSVRGLGANPGNDGLEQSTGVFMDGVYLGRPGMAVAHLIDISQIELLRGPQGTLFGKNTTAGAVNITTTAPSFTAGGALEATGGNHGYGQIQGSITGPITETLAARLTAYASTHEGYVRRTTLGGYGAVHNDGVRGQLLYKPNDDFSLRLIGEFHEENDTNVTTALPNWGATPAAWQKKLDAAGGRIEISPRGDANASNSPTYLHMHQAGLSAQADWRLGDGFALTSITAWRNWYYDSASDADASSADVLYSGYKVKYDQFSQELRLATPVGRPVEAVIGAYYFRQNTSSDQYTYYGRDAAMYLSGLTAAQLAVVAPTTPAVAALLAYPQTRWDVWATPRTHSYALFAQGTWHVTPKLNVTAGFRETYEKKDETVWRPIPISTLTGQPVPGLAGSLFPATYVKVSNWAPSGLLSVDYRVNDRVMAYASVSQGQKAGGASATLPASGLDANSLKVKPEVAQDFEAGVKSQLFDRRLTLNANLFYTRVRDYQATYFDNKSGTVTSILTNVGKVRSRGVEVEAVATPITGLTLNANASYNEATYTSYPNGPCPAGSTASICDLTGRPVVGAPRWIANLSGHYERPLGDGLIGYAGAEYSWRSSRYGYQDLSEHVRIGAYGLANLRVGLRREDGTWDAMLWVKNAADTRYATSYFSLGSLAPGAYLTAFGDPRTYGATLRTRF
ncbi:MAG: TonB-dependent receptor [Pseudomonadota bacterium]|uniref:TonB-dependent receptor n=1 Tax=Phenylobacterium sp. TaxID=1871053 RepID=UPI0025F1B23A|nr:TonB-dependent receptor [Phenylobacterium sp.]MBT9472708.1 TonB-dependent receptor [Phenylobacterium sp.]